MFRVFLQIFSLVVSLVSATIAQSTIFNVPSTDVIPEKSILIETDFIAHFDKLKNGGFQSYGYRTAYGLTKKVEIGTNVFYTREADSSPAEFQPNLKFKAYENEKHGIAVSTGAQVFVPLNRSAGTRSYGMVYINASKALASLRGMRLTGGGYQTVGTSNDFGTKRGFIAAVEQPIKGKLSFVGDWSSGTNRFGYSAAGFNYMLTKRQFLMFGYNWGNSGRGNNAFSAFYGLTY